MNTTKILKVGSIKVFPGHIVVKPGKSLEMVKSRYGTRMQLEFFNKNGYNKLANPVIGNV